MSDGDHVVGIDLGTTNSEIAAFVGDEVKILGWAGSNILPSCVGLSPADVLLVGEPARNQLLIYPERTVRSVKRKMGSPETIRLGEREFTPQEISALILRELDSWAAPHLGRGAHKAVITVPAYFSDAQRNATREAGALAGLDVVRIVNEPTAASLAYGYGGVGRRTVMIFDLGGGTFDVSIVTMESDITEVLASHGNNRLGGDDFNELLVERLLEAFREKHGFDLRDGHPIAYSRLWWAAEEAKKKLSFEPYATVREETLATVNGKPLHLQVELARRDYESMIRPLLESTLESVTKAMEDAGVGPGDLDAILLVGGSTRTPLVSEILRERTGILPRQDIHPDLCVALGAGVLAARLSGEEIDRVLVDVSPYSFGPSYLGERSGVLYPHCYHPIIRRNTPLPITRTDNYYTASPYQTVVEIKIYQGEDPDALKDILVGNFMITGLTPMEEPNEVLCRMRLDLDGILQVEAIEKRTGKSKRISISGALQPKTGEELAAARERLEQLFETRPAADEAGERTYHAHPVPRHAAEAVSTDSARSEAVEERRDPRRETLDRLEQEAAELVERVRRLFSSMHGEDRVEAADLDDRIRAAISGRDTEALSRALGELKELLFFVEGR